MTKDIRTFLIRLSMFLAIIAVISMSLTSTNVVPIKYVSPALPFLLLFFYIITALVYYIVIKASEKKFSNFVNAFMLSTFLKLMLYPGIMLVYIFLINRKDAVPFIGSFFICYILFTVFETVYILAATRKNKSK